MVIHGAATAVHRATAAAMQRKYTEHIILAEVSRSKGHRAALAAAIRNTHLLGKNFWSCIQWFAFHVCKSYVGFEQLIYCEIKDSLPDKITHSKISSISTILLQRLL